MAPPKALIFDLDGVLIRSEAAHMSNWLQVFAQFGIGFPESRIKELQGLRGEQVAELLQRDFGRAVDGVDLDELIAEKRRVFLAESLPMLEPIAGAEAFLRSQKGVLPLGLVTSARLGAVGKVLQQMGWRNIFEALVGAEHVQNPKPHPEPYQRAIDRFKIAPEDCLVFEDSPVGLQSASAAGARVCGVASILGQSELVKFGATWVIEDFEDERNLLAAMEGERPATGSWWKRLLAGRS